MFQGELWWKSFLEIPMLRWDMKFRYTLHFLSLGTLFFFQFFPRGILQGFSLERNNLKEAFWKNEIRSDTGTLSKSTKLKCYFLKVDLRCDWRSLLEYGPKHDINGYWQINFVSNFEYCIALQYQKWYFKFLTLRRVLVISDYKFKPSGSDYGRHGKNTTPDWAALP